MLLRLWRLSNFVNLPLSLLAFFGLFWFGFNRVELAIAWLVLVGLVAGQTLRTTYNRSLRRDRRDLAERASEPDLSNM
jgi:hypothetical protein